MTHIKTVNELNSQVNETNLNIEKKRQSKTILCGGTLNQKAW